MDCVLARGPLEYWVMHVTEFLIMELATETPGSCGPNFLTAGTIWQQTLESSTKIDNLLYNGITRYMPTENIYILTYLIIFDYIRNKTQVCEDPQD